jgi:diguanylate cyclase (GGDEF)-like protein/PAS domain S-box-containing protein
MNTNNVSQHKSWLKSIKAHAILGVLLMGTLPAIAVVWLGFNALFEKIQSDRINTVGAVANVKHEQLIMFLTQANNRASFFLSILSAKCDVENFTASCTTPLVKAYLASEKAQSATLYIEGRKSLVVGSTPSQSEKITLRAGQLAKFIGTGPDHNLSYYISAENPSSGLQLDTSYPSKNLQEIFTVPLELGKSGEIFLADGDGYFVTQAKYSSAHGQHKPIHTRPMRACLSQRNDNVKDLDYRDVNIIHGFRFVPEFGSACIMAHIDQSEAFSILTTLKNYLLLAIMFSILPLFIIIIYTVKNISKPLEQFITATRAIMRGDYTARVNVSAVNEISELEVAFNTMTEQLFSSNLQLNQKTKELKASEERYAKLFKDSPDAIALADAETGVILDFNQTFLNLLGWERDDLIGKPQTMIHPDAGDAAVSSSFERHRSDEAGKSIETQIKAKDGRIIDVIITATTLDMNDRKVVLGSFQDITARKQIETELRIAATAFESQEGIIVTDASRQILRVNRAFTNITGYAAEEVIGKNPSLLSSGRHDAKFYEAMWSGLNQTGTWQGEIWDRRKNGEDYPEYLTITAVKDSAGKISNYVATLTDRTVSKKAEEEIKFLAFFDPLTHLPNRRLLLDRLQHALATSARSGKQGALLFLDLDEFKALNDTHGHDIGDLLLQQVAERLTALVRESDTVARLGGDEFVVMLENLSEHDLEAAAQAETIGNKILSAFNQPYQLGHQQCQSSTSIGITLFNDHERQIDEMLKQADIAMYQAKKAGRNSLRFFDLQMQININARAAMEGELSKALQQQQFQLYYQIQVDGSGHPLGAEALIRWNHPERGLIPPLQFIPLAEETGLIFPIGQWVLDTACAQLKAWQQDVVSRNLTLSVNVSAKQFRQADFVARVQATVQNHAINPMRLKLELTESMLLEHIEDTIASMNTLQAIGIQFSLDDFGTGYSSLQYLKQLPLDQLKIDRSFVRDIAIDSSDQAIVSTIIAMASSLDLNVIAEGVETEEQRQFLVSRGCNAYQGYLFGKPVPIAQFDALIRRGDLI